VRTRAAGAIDQLLKQEMGALDASMRERGFQSVDPLLRLQWINVGRILLYVLVRVSVGRFPLSHRGHSPFCRPLAGTWAQA
jgi:uncharacterized membrane protein